MSASEHINPKIRMFHISWNETPPHELEPSRMQEYRPDNNVHPDVLHMGTREAALSIHRTHLHEYEMDANDVDPVTYGDSANLLEKESNRFTRPDHFARAFHKNMVGVQPSLWENTPADPIDSINRNAILPYRNLSESPGSVSFIVPKSAIASGKVKYVGVETDIEKERNAVYNKS